MDPLDAIRQLIGGLTTLTAEELLDPAHPGAGQLRGRPRAQRPLGPRPQPRRRPGRPAWRPASRSRTPETRPVAGALRGLCDSLGLLTKAAHARVAAIRQIVLGANPVRAFTFIAHLTHNS
jgi:hypothetical protein